MKLQLGINEDEVKRSRHGTDIAISISNSDEDSDSKVSDEVMLQVVPISINEV